MGMMVDGEWKDTGYNTAETRGRFQRSESQFRHWITPDGSPGPSGKGGFAAETDRYHLYVSLACPWAHRTLLFRALKDLEPMITVSVTHWFMGTDGWTFEPGQDVAPDTVNNARCLHDVYRKADPGYTGRVTVPVLWDKKTGALVNNESSEIIRMFNSAFDGIGARPGDYYPADLRPEIDAINARVYDTLNNGVYKSGFATTQEAYEEAVEPLFATLDWLEGLLSTRRYLCGDRLTEADLRLFPTLVRFDPVYVGHFKCNLRRIVDYPNLWAYTREIYQMPGVASTVNMTHNRRHYFESHETINPTRIVPLGPKIDFLAPHGRG
ncbi:MAG: glutathione S-transferase family protein [Betaproteobacteria bacterium]|nr:glutathione S-transferase family protein [Betaproteobacteria bacterium]